MNVLWDERDIDPHFYCEEDFNLLFDNKDMLRKYTVHGYQDLWDGKYEGHIPRLFDSIKEAIFACEEGFGHSYTVIYEENYGRLYCRVIHHDSVRGGNLNEIRELTKLGIELYYDYDYDVGKLLDRKGATRNVKYTTRLRKHL